MLYSLTDKLDFSDDPIIEVNGKKLTVNADAKTVLKLMAIANDGDEVKAMLEAEKLLFSDKDRKVIDSMNLSMKNYTTLITVAMQLSAGEDPDAEATGE